MTDNTFIPVPPAGAWLVTFNQGRDYRESVYLLPAEAGTDD